MKVRFLSDLALSTLRRNLDGLKQFFKEPTNEGLLNHLRELIQEEPLKDSNYTLPDSIRLIPSDQRDKEFEAVQQIYLPLKDLPHSIACDERLWAGLCIDCFWSYTKERWNKQPRSDNWIRDHFLFLTHGKKGYTRNAISRLWWYGDLTYDDERSDPFEITRYVIFNGTDYILNLLERAWSSNRNICREFIAATEKARIEDAWPASVVRHRIRQLCKYLNLLGGVYILDALPKGMIFDKIYAEAKALHGALA